MGVRQGTFYTCGQAWYCLTLWLDNTMWLDMWYSVVRQLDKMETNAAIPLFPGNQWIMDHPSIIGWQGDVLT